MIMIFFLLRGGGGWVFSPSPPPAEQGKQGGLRLNWLGQLLTMDQQEGFALLETSHGHGVAFLVWDDSDGNQIKKPTLRM